MHRFGGDRPHSGCIAKKQSHGMDGAGSGQTGTQGGQSMLFERALTHLEPTSIQPTQCRHRSDVGSAGLARARASHAEIGTVAGPRTAMQGTGLDGRLVPMTQAHKYSHQGQHLPPRCPVAERGLPARSAHQCQGHQLHNQDRQLHHQFRWSHKTGAPHKSRTRRLKKGEREG